MEWKTSNVSSRWSQHHSRHTGIIVRENRPHFNLAKSCSGGLSVLLAGESPALGAINPASRSSEGPARQVRLEGPGCRVRFSEGRACRVRRTTLDHPFHFIGHDKRAPPFYASGPACRVRSATFDDPSRLLGRDRHAPPSGHDKRAPPNSPSEGSAYQVRSQLLRNQCVGSPTCRPDD